MPMAGILAFCLTRASVLTLLQEKYLKKKAQKHVQQAGIHGIGRNLMMNDVWKKWCLQSKHAYNYTQIQYV